MSKSKGPKKQNVLRLRNKDQRILWEMELSGQISDGAWENASPDWHWIRWCDAEVKVAKEGKPVGRNFKVAKVGYRLSTLYRPDCDLSRRMIAYVRLARHYGRKKAKVLEYVLDLDGVFRGPPQFKDSGKYTTWGDIRAKLSKFDMDEVQQVIEDDSEYGLKELKADLRDIQAIMKVYHGSDIEWYPSGKDYYAGQPPRRYR